MAENTKWYQVGRVLQKKAPGKGVYCKLGDDKYTQLDVTVVITDKTGEVVATVKNPVFQVRDPRQRPGITEEQAAKIPDFVRQELSLAIDG